MNSCLVCDSSLQLKNRHNVCVWLYSCVCVYVVCVVGMGMLLAYKTFRYGFLQWLNKPGTSPSYVMRPFWKTYPQSTWLQFSAEACAPDSDVLKCNKSIFKKQSGTAVHQGGALIIRQTDFRWARSLLRTIITLERTLNPTPKPTPKPTLNPTPKLLRTLPRNYSKNYSEKLLRNLPNKPTPGPLFFLQCLACRRDSEAAVCS
jgi:hypothetical protein